MNNSHSSHPNSKLITIMRANNFVQEAQDQTQVADWMSMSAKNVGPYFQSYVSRIIGSGLTFEEQKLLMPHLIPVPATDPTFPKAVFDFFNGLVTKIPFTGGKTLQIGLKVTNDEPVSAENMPLEIEDFVRYRHAKGHPWMANNIKDAQGNQLKFFYMDDPDATHKEEADKMALEDKADGIWLKIREQNGKVGMLLTLMGTDERDFVGMRNEDSRKRTALKALISKNPGKFLDIYEDQHFESKYWLKAMVNANVVKRVGEAYVYGDNSTLIGRTETEAILFLENPEKEDVVTMLKGNTQDVLKKPKSSSKKRMTT